jgi:hypothetical protein
VPTSEVAHSKEKPLEGGFNSNLMIADQAASNAGFDFRRNAMKPMPARPETSSPKWRVQGRPVSNMLLSPSIFSLPQFAGSDEEWHRIGGFNRVDLPLGMICAL